MRSHSVLSIRRQLSNPSTYSMGNIPRAATSGKDVEQRAEHIVRCSNHVSAGFGEQIRLAQIRQRIEEVLIVGVRYLLRILVEQLAAARDCGTAAADCARHADQWKCAADGAHLRCIGNRRPNFRVGYDLTDSPIWPLPMSGPRMSGVTDTPPISSIRDMSF